MSTWKACACLPKGNVVQDGPVYMEREGSGRQSLTPGNGRPETPSGEGRGRSLRQEVPPISYKQSGVNPELRTSTRRSWCDGCPGVCESESCSVVSDSLRPHTVHGILHAGVGSHSLHQGNLPNPGIEPWSPTFIHIGKVDSLSAEPPGKPQNIGVGSLPHHLWIFLTQESNHSLLHSRRILYQLSHQGCPAGVHGTQQTWRGEADV